MILACERGSRSGLAMTRIMVGATVGRRLVRGESKWDGMRQGGERKFINSECLLLMAVSWQRYPTSR